MCLHLFLRGCRLDPDPFSDDVLFIWRCTLLVFFPIIFHLRLSLIHVAGFYFNDKAIQTYMDIHTAFLISSTFCCQKEWLFIGPCAKQQDLYASPLHRQSFGCMTLQIPVLPTASPSNLETPNLFRSPCISFLYKGSLVSFVRVQREGVSYAICLSLLDIFRLVWEFFLPSTCLPMAFSSPLFFWLSPILWCIGTSSSQSNHLSMDIEYVSMCFYGE